MIKLSAQLPSVVGTGLVGAYDCGPRWRGGEARHALRRAQRSAVSNSPSRDKQSKANFVDACAAILQPEILVSWWPTIRFLS